MYILRKDWTVVPQRPKDNETVPKTVGTLMLAYVHGKSGPAELSFVRIEDFQRLQRAIDAYRIAQRLLEMSKTGDTSWCRIIYSAGMSLSTLRPPAPYQVKLTIYQYGEGQTGLRATSTVLINSFELEKASLINTVEV